MENPPAYRNYPSKIPVLYDSNLLLQTPPKDIEIEILRIDHPIRTGIPMMFNSSLREKYQSGMASRRSPRSPRVYNRKLVLPMTDRIQIQDMDALEGFGDVPRHHDRVDRRSLMINTDNSGDIYDESILQQEMNLDTIARMMENHRFLSTDSSTYMSNFDIEEESIYNTISMNSFLGNPPNLYGGDRVLQEGSPVSCEQLSPSENEFYDLNEGNMEDILSDMKIGSGNRSASNDLVDNEVADFATLYTASEMNSEPSEESVRNLPLPDTTDEESTANGESKRDTIEELSIDMQALRCKDANDAAMNANGNNLMNRPTLVSWIKGFYVTSLNPTDAAKSDTSIQSIGDSDCMD